VQHVQVSVENSGIKTSSTASEYWSNFRAAVTQRDGGHCVLGEIVLYLGTTLAIDVYILVHNIRALLNEQTELFNFLLSGLIKQPFENWHWNLASSK
jgi:hypothetical protein